MGLDLGHRNEVVARDVQKDVPVFESAQDF